MKAALLENYNRFVWTDVPLPKCGDTQVLIKVSYAGICGSDLHIYQGEFHPRTPIPFIPGHEFAGVIAKTGSAVHDLHEGDSLVIWGAGRIGQCILQAARTFTQARIFLVDIDEKRLINACEHIENVIPVNALDNDPAQVIMDMTDACGEFALALNALEKDQLKPQILISDIAAADQIQDIFTHIIKNPHEHLKVLLDFTGQDL